MNTEMNKDNALFLNEKEKEYGWPGEFNDDNLTEFEKIVFLKEQELFDLSDDDLLRFLDTIPSLYTPVSNKTGLEQREPINKSDFDFRTNRFKSLRNCIQYKLEDKKRNTFKKRKNAILY